MFRGERRMHSGEGPKPKRKPSWYERCFPIRKDKFQPSEEMQSISQEGRELLEQCGQRIEVPLSGRPTTRDQANHREATRENTRIKQIVDEHLKSAEETFDQTVLALRKLQEACNELIKDDNTHRNQLTTKIKDISNNASTKINEQSLALQNACDKLKLAEKQLGVMERARNEIDKCLASVQSACNELRKTKDQLETLRDFLYLRKQVNEARTQLEADLGEATDGNPRRIKELARNIEERTKSAFNDESLDNPWMFKKACEELRQTKDQLELLRKASRAWKQVDQIKAESIGMLSGTIKDAARMQAGMADSNFELFLFSLEQHPVHDNRWQLAETWFESNDQKLKDIVVGDLKHRWKVLTESRKILFKDHEDLAKSSSMQKTTEKYGLFADWLGEEGFAQASEHVGQLAKSTLSYEFKDKAVEHSRRTKMVDSLRALLRVTERNHRPERVKGIVDEFNNTLKEMRDKLAAADYLPKELKYKVVEDTVTIMKDFKESCGEALHDYAKFKGRKTRERGEERIKGLNIQLNTLSEAVSIYKLNHEIQTESIESLRDPYKGNARNARSEINSAFERLLNQEGDWQSLKKSIEGAYGDFKKMLHTKIEPDSKKESITGKETNGNIITKEIDIKTENMIIYKKDNIKEVASATTGAHVPNQDSCFISEYGAGVCDGVSEGGRGAEASGMAKGIFGQKLPELLGKIKKDGLSPEQVNAELKQITFNTSNKIKCKLNERIKDVRNMATTTLSAVISIGNGKMAAINVGDSRVYVLKKDNTLVHKTLDISELKIQSLRNIVCAKFYYNISVLEKFDDSKYLLSIQEKVGKMSDEEYKRFKDTQGFEDLDDFCAKYFITNSASVGYVLGSKEECETTIGIFDVDPGDRIIVTSDGVHDVLSSQEIIDCVSECRTAEDAARALVRKAREKGLDGTNPRCKDDDTTAVVMICSGEGRDNAETSDEQTVQSRIDTPSTSYNEIGGDSEDRDYIVIEPGIPKSEEEIVEAV